MLNSLSIDVPQENVPKSRLVGVVEISGACAGMNFSIQPVEDVPGAPPDAYPDCVAMKVMRVSQFEILCDGYGVIVPWVQPAPLSVV